MKLRRISKKVSPIWDTLGKDRLEKLLLGLMLQFIGTIYSFSGKSQLSESLPRVHKVS